MPRRGRTARILLLGQLAYRGAVALYTVLLARLLDRAEFGDVSYLLALVAVGVVVADGGFSRLLVRDVARSAGSHGDLVRSLLIVRSAWVLATACAVAAVATLAGLPVAGAVIPVLAVLVLLDATASGFEAAGVGAELPWRVAAPQLMGAAVLVAAVAAFAAGTEVSVVGAVAVLAAAAGGRLAGQLWLWRLPSPQAAGVTRDRAAQWARQAFPFLVLAMLGALYYRVDMVILHERRGAVETASYGAAYRVADALLVVAGVAAASVSAHLSRLHRDDPGEVLATWRRYAVRTVLVLAPPLALLALFAEPVSEILFGARYRETTGQDLRLLAPGMLFMTLQILNAALLFTSDLQRRLVTLSLAQVAFNVVLTYVLVGRWGSEGAAVATSVSEVVTFLYFSTFIWLRFRT